MYSNNTVYIRVSEIQKICEEYGIQLSSFEAKSRSLLNRNANGYYKFAHKSILEFVLANKAIKDTQFRKIIVLNGFAGYDMLDLFLREMSVSYVKKLLKIYNGIYLLENGFCEFLQLSEIDLSNTKIINCCFEGCNLSNAVLRQVDFDNTSLKGANLYRADLYNSKMFGTDLREANLREAVLRKADLREVILIGANLEKADLREANLRRANLKGVVLSDAYLNLANLRKADLRGVVLIGAHLEEADLNSAKIESSIWTKRNILELRPLMEWAIFDYIKLYDISELERIDKKSYFRYKNS